MRSSGDEMNNRPSYALQSNNGTTRDVNSFVNRQHIISQRRLSEEDTLLRYGQWPHSLQCIDFILKCRWRLIGFVKVFTYLLYTSAHHPLPPPRHRYFICETYSTSYKNIQGL